MVETRESFNFYVLLDILLSTGAFTTSRRRGKGITGEFISS